MNDLYLIHNNLINKYKNKYTYKLVKSFKQIGASNEKKTELSYICESIPYIINNVRRIIAIGDVHGDLLLVLSSLYISNIINIYKTKPKEEYIKINYKNTNIYITWIGNDTHVVQIGDQIDRCRPMSDNCDHPEETLDDEDSDIIILYFFTDLNKLAMKHGGMVISLLGNHELMNINGNFSYVSYKGITNYSSEKEYNKGLEARKKLFSIEQQELSKFLGCTRLGAIIINKILFIHAGLIPKLALEYKIDDINILLKSWLTKTINNDTDDKKTYNNLPFTLSSIKKLFMSKDSILWTRKYGSLPTNLSMNDSRCEKYVLPTYKIYDVKGMIIGHTPQFMMNKMGINSTCDNSVWRIDDGMSKAFAKYNNDAGKKVQVLEITNKDNDILYTVLKGDYFSNDLDILI